MASSFSNLVNNLSEGIHKSKFEYRNDIKKCETCGVKYKDCVSFFEYTSFKDDLIEYKCLCCNKKKKIVENLKKQFFDTYKLSNQDLKLILLF